MRGKKRIRISNSGFSIPILSCFSSLEALMYLSHPPPPLAIIQSFSVLPWGCVISSIDVPYDRLRPPCLEGYANKNWLKAIHTFIVWRLFRSQEHEQKTESYSKKSKSEEIVYQLDNANPSSLVILHFWAWCIRMYACDAGKSIEAYCLCKNQQGIDGSLLSETIHQVDWSNLTRLRPTIFLQNLETQSKPPKGVGCAKLEKALKHTACAKTNSG